MANVEKILTEMRSNPKSIRFNDLRKVCETYFGPASQNSTSHCVFKTPWQGDPRVNIQSKKGMAKAYQVKQVLLAIDRLELDDGN
ncbi:MAG: toxin HicA [Proteobacteria bacterium]|nr:toxin HicA [Pseudomonadota bacterium]